MTNLSITTRQVEVGTHESRTQFANDQMDALQCFANEYRDSCDHLKRDAGAMVPFMFALSAQGPAPLRNALFQPITFFRYFTLDNLKPSEL